MQIYNKDVTDMGTIQPTYFPYTTFRVMSTNH